MDRQIERKWKDKWIVRPMESQTDGHTDREKDRQTNGHLDRWTDR